MPDASRLLCVLAHPDDVGCFAGGVLAHATARGMGTYVWVATGRAPSGLPDAALRAAARVLGVRGISVLPYHPNGLNQLDAQDLIAQLTLHIRQIQPHVVLTCAPQSTPPSRMLVSQWATSAVQAAANLHTSIAPDWAPHQVEHLVYVLPSGQEDALTTSCLPQCCIDLRPYQQQVAQSLDALKLAGTPPSEVVCVCATSTKPDLFSALC